jgi:DNA-directed RNA polymerase specialized sigma24 family protein
MASIDEIREWIEHRMQQTLAEAEHLRPALTALDDDAPGRVPQDTSRETQARNRRRRAARGSVRQAVLDALRDGKARTSREIAEVTGLARATVASTLSRLLAEGAISKPSRGYQLVQDPTGAACAPG